MCDPGRWKDDPGESLVKAGTGRFLDVMAGILQLDVDELGAYALKAEEPVRISSTCTVFAESEVISQLSKGVKLPDLIAGICNSVASRTAALAKRADVTEVVYMTGGVAKNIGVRSALSRELGVEVHTIPDAQYMGLWGQPWQRTKRGQRNIPTEKNMSKLTYLYLHAFPNVI